jgi:hypothetical protein
MAFYVDIEKGKRVRAAADRLRPRHGVIVRSIHGGFSVVLCGVSGFFFIVFTYLRPCYAGKTNEG